MLGFMRALIPTLMLLFTVVGCDNRRPLSDKERREDYGDCPISQGAPFGCIYVGLDTNETALFETNFWRFADQHGIHRPKKHYRIYSGPGVFTCISDHVAVFECATETADIVAFHEMFKPISVEQAAIEQAAAGFGLFMEHFWPTNASRIIKDGHEVLAPFTDAVKMAPNDTNYSLQDFKLPSDALTNALQSAFPDRAVRVIAYDGNTNYDGVAK